MPGKPSHFAPPELLSVISVACADDVTNPTVADPDLADGTHLRVYAGLGQSFPLTPFAVCQAKSQQMRCDFFVKDGVYFHAGLFGIGDGVPAEITLLLPDQPDLLPIGVNLSPQDGELDRVELIDQRGRTAAVREAPPWSFSAPRPHRLRVTGRAGNIIIEISVIHLETVLGLHDDRLTCIGLPLVGNEGGWEPSQWYLSMHGLYHGETQVVEGAPKRLNPMDAPDGNLTPIDHSSEIARVRKTVDEAFLDRLRHMVRDPTPPWLQPAQVLKEVIEATNIQAAAARTKDLLQITAIDPGPARYMGFALHEPDVPASIDPARDWDCFIVIGAIAWERNSLSIGPAPNDEREDVLLHHLARAIEGVPLGPTGDHQSIDAAKSVVRDLIDAAIANGFDARVLVAGTLVLPPDVPPAVPEASEVERTWDPSQGDEPSDSYSIDMSFPPSPLTSLVALGRNDGNGYTTTHSKLENLDANPTWRAEPRLMGRRSRKVRRRAFGKVIVDRPEALLSDTGRPAGGPVNYLVYGSDPFGRFGSPATVTVVPPERPLPPEPVLAWSISLHAPAGHGPASPGTLSVPFFVQNPGEVDRDQLIEIGDRIMVPRVRDLAPGSLAIAAVDIAINSGEPSRLDLSTPGPVDSPPIDLPDLDPFASGEVELRVRYVDQDGREGPWKAHRVSYNDIRAPAPLPTVRGLYWTTIPGPSPEAELVLEWPAAENVGYRVYRAGPQAFGIFPEPTDPRGKTAGEILAKIEGDNLRPPRSSFGLLPGTPEVSGDKARFTARLSRSLQEVTILRVVPHGPTGAEPTFDEAPFVAVAVPDTRPPVHPSLDVAEIDQETGACTIKVSMYDFPFDKLRREEPGLFDGNGGGVAPRFRLRRAVGPVSDPVFARVIAPDEPLKYIPTGDDVPEHFLGVFELPGPLVPFVSYLFWAEVRLPPERRFAPAAAPEQLAEETDITTPDERARQPSPRPFSLPSPALRLMFVPPPPAPPQGSAVVAANGTQLRITVNNPPSAHAAAIDRFRLEAFASQGEGALTPLLSPHPRPPIESGEASFTLDGVVDQVWVAYVDPRGKAGKAARIM